MGASAAAFFSEIHEPIRNAILAAAGGKPSPQVHQHAEWFVFGGWLRGRNELVVARFDGGELEMCGRAKLERLSGQHALIYRRDTPAIDPIILVRDIETAPERGGAGRLLFGLIGALADADGQWAFLDAAPRADVEYVLRVFRAAGFAEARPSDPDDCIFVRAPQSHQ